MSELVPAWPPTTSRSTTSVRSPSEAAYTAAASPADRPRRSRGRSCPRRRSTRRGPPTPRRVRDRRERGRRAGRHRQARGVDRAGSAASFAASGVPTPRRSRAGRRSARAGRRARASGGRAIPDHPDELHLRPIRLGPLRQELADDGIEVHLGGSPGLGDVVLELPERAALQDRRGRLAIAPGDEERAPGVRVELPHAREQVDAGHLPGSLVRRSRGRSFPSSRSLPISARAALAERWGTIR